MCAVGFAAHDPSTLGTRSTPATKRSLEPNRTTSGTLNEGDDPSVLEEDEDRRRHQ